MDAAGAPGARIWHPRKCKEKLMCLSPGWKSEPFQRGEKGNLRLNISHLWMWPSVCLTPGNQSSSESSGVKANDTSWRIKRVALRGRIWYRLVWMRERSSGPHISLVFTADAAAPGFVSRVLSIAFTWANIDLTSPHVKSLWTLHVWILNLADKLPFNFGLVNVRKMCSKLCTATPLCVYLGQQHCGGKSFVWASSRSCG